MSEVLSQKDMKKVFLIVEYLDMHNWILPAVVRKVTGRSAVTVRRYLGILYDVGVLEFEGS